MSLDQNQENVLDELWPRICNQVRFDIENTHENFRSMDGTVEQVLTGKRYKATALLRIDRWALTEHPDMKPMIEAIQHYRLADINQQQNMVVDAIEFRLAFYPAASEYLYDKHTQLGWGHDNSIRTPIPIVANRYLSEAIF